MPKVLRIYAKREKEEETLVSRALESSKVCAMAMRNGQLESLWRALTSDIKDETRHRIRFRRCSPQSRTNNKPIDIPRTALGQVSSSLVRHSSHDPHYCTVGHI